MAMDERKQRVLRAIVSLYSVEGEPVGSSVLANYFDMAVSSATLRNEMAALTRLGLLEQPHTSAGRVPSAKGYRYYIDHLLDDSQPLDRVARARVDSVFASLDHEPDRLAQGAVKALAQLRRRSVHRPLRGGAGGAERRRHPGRHLGGLRPHTGGPGAGGPDPGKGRPAGLPAQPQPDLRGRRGSVAAGPGRPLQPDRAGAGPGGQRRRRHPGRIDMEPRIPGLSVVSCRYLVGGGLYGSVALVGPTRMPFSKVIPLLEAFADELGEGMAGKRKDAPQAAPYRGRP